MKIVLELNYRTPNHANARHHWRQIVAEKHKAQDALLSALDSAAFNYSTLMPNTPQSKTCLMAFQTLVSFMATKRVRSVLKSSRKKLLRTRSKELSSK